MMRKPSFLIVSLLLFPVMTLLAQEYSTYQLEMLGNLDAKGIKLGIMFDAGSYAGPTDPEIIIGDCGSLIFIDQVRNGLIFSDIGLSLRDRVKAKILDKYSQFGSIYWCYNNEIIMRSGQEIVSFDSFGNRIIEIDFLRPFSPSVRDIEVSDIRIGSVFFFIDDRNRLFSIANPGPDPEENAKRMLDEAATRALLKEPDKYGLQGVTKDARKRIFLNGELQTRDYKKDIEYWMEKNSTTDILIYRNLKGHKFKPIHRDTYGMEYIGVDNKGNSYWMSLIGYTMEVFSSYGLIIDMFDYDPDIIRTKPAVHPSGDIFFLGYDEEGVNLYRVKNVWDTAGRAAWYKEHGGDVAGTPVTPLQYALVISDKVRIRESPSLTGVQLGFLSDGQRVKVLKRSDEKMKVDAMFGYWYKIKSEDGTVGWSYGAFLKIDE